MNAQDLIDRFAEILQDGLCDLDDTIPAWKDLDERERGIPRRLARYLIAHGTSVPATLAPEGLIYAPGAGRLTILRVEGCARCGGVHEGVVIAAFQRPSQVGPFLLTHWGVCPTTGEPLPVQVKPVDEQPPEILAQRLASDTPQ